jgi:hypothetical protein
MKKFYGLRASYRIEGLNVLCSGLRRHYLKIIQSEIFKKLTKKSWSGSEFEPDFATADTVNLYTQHCCKHLY